MRVVTVTDYYPNSPVLDSLRIPYTRVSPHEFDTVNLFLYDALYIDWRTSGEVVIIALRNRMNDIDDFLQSGGGLVFVTVGNGYQLSWLPVPIGTEWYYGEWVKVEWKKFEE